jgi:hypothetical protein
MSDTSLSTVERKTLRTLESKIETGKQAFIEVGTALRDIRDGRLYRESHKSFDSYVQDRWNFQKRYAVFLISAVDVAENVNHGSQKVVDGAVISSVPEIPNERVARELAKVPEDEQADVWEEVTTTSPKVTAAAVRSVVEKRAETAAKPQPPLKPSYPPYVQEALDNARVGNAIVDDINAALAKVRALASGSGMELLLNKHQAITSFLQSAKSAVSTTIPYAVCPRCKGAKCPQCGNYGWVTSLMSQQLKTKE